MVQQLLLVLVLKKKAEGLCIIPGVLLAGVFLSSSGIFDNKPFELLSPDVSNFFLAITSVYGAVQILRAVMSWFIIYKE